MTATVSGYNAAMVLIATAIIVVSALILGRKG